MCSINVISAWSCKLWSQRIASGEGYPAEGEEFGVQCLNGYCYSTNISWAAIACFTAAIGAVSSLNKDPRLAIFFVILFVCRGIWCCGEIALALANGSSCQAWSLSKSFWLPIVTLAHVVIFASLALKFARSIHHTQESRVRYAEELQALNFQTTEASDRDTPPPFEAAPELRAAKAVTNTTGPIAAVDGRRISSRPRPSQSLSSDPGGGAAMER